MPRRRRFSIRREDYVDAEDFAAALWFAGGPEFGQIDQIRHLPGLYGELLRAIWGSGEAEFNAATAASERREQQARPDLIRRKWSAPARKPPVRRKPKA